MKWIIPLLIFLSQAALAPASQAEELWLDIQDVPASESLSIGLHAKIWQPLEDDITEEEIVQGRKDSLFSPSNQDIPGKGFIRNSIWMRLEIHHSGSQTVPLLLESRYPLIDEVSLWTRNAQGVMQKQSLGDTIAQVEKPLYRTPLFKLQVHPGINIYYLKVKTQGSCIAALYLWHPDSFHFHFAKDVAVLGLMFGTLLTLLLYNIFLTISFRSRTYFYYSIFLLTMIESQMSMQGLWPFVLPPEGAIWMQNRGFLLWACCTYFTSILVTSYFLNVRVHMPRAHHLFKLMLVMCGVITTAGFFLDYNTFAKVNAAFFAVGSVALLGSSFLAAARGYRPAFYYSFSWVFLFINNILLYLNLDGVIHIPQIVQWGNFPGVICDGILMSLALGDRMNFIQNKDNRTILDLNKELKDHLTQVESVVSERTETIRTILDNIASGFLMINRQATIAPGYTRSCRPLLGTDFHEGQSFLDVLKLDRKTEGLWRLAIDQIFADSMPLEVTLAQLPRQASVHGKYLQFYAAGIRDQTGALKNILITITDGSELRKKKMEAKRDRNILRILSDIEGFRQFIAYSFAAVDRLRKTTHTREVSFILHTLKGNCQVFHLQELAARLHQLEDTPHLIQQDIDGLEQSFKNYLDRHHRVLRTQWGPMLQEKRIADEQLQKLGNFARKSEDSPLKHEVLSWVALVSAKPINGLVQGMMNDARVLAKKMKKSVLISFESHDALVHSEAEEKLIEELIHVVRNAVIHGIEEDREAIRKPKQGLIHCEFQERPDGLQITCCDDGRGFDRRIWEKTFRQRLPSSAEDPALLSLTDLVRRVSQGGFSTEKELSLYAGRGVGIESLFAAVDACQGQVNIDGVLGQGCRFEIFIPRHAPWKVAS